MICSLPRPVVDLIFFYSSPGSAEEVDQAVHETMIGSHESSFSFSTALNVKKYLEKLKMSPNILYRCFGHNLSGFHQLAVHVPSTVLVAFQNWHFKGGDGFTSKVVFILREIQSQIVKDTDGSSIRINPKSILKEDQLDLNTAITLYYGLAYIPKGKDSLGCDTDHRLVKGTVTLSKLQELLKKGETVIGHRYGLLEGTPETAKWLGPPDKLEESPSKGI